ncbi:MAG TPA: sigma-54 dependent transcriptional regulator [Tepidisphaeraceae bacterium]|nr:sigma-54 dependent transcriptional regulator [Tepidisphaeraceae bacterium]
MSDEQILIVDDTPANLDLLAQMLEPNGYRVLVAGSGQSALAVAAASLPDLILLDVMMPELDGYATCRALKENPATAGIPVIFISARDATDDLVQGFRAGGVDYITKPFHVDEVLIRVQTHLRISGLTRELLAKNAELAGRNEELGAEIQRREKAESALQAADDQLSLHTDREKEHWGLEAFVGNSQTLENILADVRRLRNFGSINVLVTGESGTGKELIARALHFGSSRSAGPFIPVNCVAVPTELAESAFFGHVRGAFTGATMDRRGFFELAHGGTLFLDEIGDMPTALQAKLLRVLEDGCVVPVGGAKDRHVDVRVVSATNADLKKKVFDGAFRRDLYFRLAQYNVEVPPLRERAGDIAPLATHFIKLFATEMGVKPPPMGEPTLAALAAYSFPGNIRELKNIIERALIESGGGPIKPQHIRLPAWGAAPAPPRPRAAEPAPAGSRPDWANDIPLNLEAAEEFLIRRALSETGGNIAEAARRLGINRTRIYRHMKSV